MIREEKKCQEYKQTKYEANSEEKRELRNNKRTSKTKMKPLVKELEN